MLILIPIDRARARQLRARGIHFCQGSALELRGEIGLAAVEDDCQIGGSLGQDYRASECTFDHKL